MLTKKQLGIIHGLKNKLGLSDEIYRSVLRVVGKVESSKDLSQVKFLPVLAALEDAGDDDSFYWRQRMNREQPATAAGRGGGANERMVWKAKRLYNEYIVKAAECGVPVDRRYQLAGLVANISHQRTREVEQLQSREAWQLIEQLKAILSRLDKPVAPPTVNILAPTSSPSLFPTQSSALSPQHSPDPFPDYDAADPEPHDDGELMPAGAPNAGCPSAPGEEDIPF